MIYIYSSFIRRTSPGSDLSPSLAKDKPISLITLPGIISLSSSKITLEVISFGESKLFKSCA